MTHAHHLLPRCSFPSRVCTYTRTRNPCSFMRGPSHPMIVLQPLGHVHPGTYWTAMTLSTRGSQQSHVCLHTRQSMLIWIVWFFLMNSNLNFFLNKPLIWIILLFGHPDKQSVWNFHSLFWSQLLVPCRLFPAYSTGLRFSSSFLKVDRKHEIFFNVHENVRKSQFYHPMLVQLWSSYITPLRCSHFPCRQKHLPCGAVLRPRSYVCKEPMLGTGQVLWRCSCCF